MTITIQAMMLSQNPADTISLMDTFSVPNTIAFGGVPTGNMNAQFAAMLLVPLKSLDVHLM